jgi:hypothetical protein
MLFADPALAQTAMADRGVRHSLPRVILALVSTIVERRPDARPIAVVVLLAGKAAAVFFIGRWLQCVFGDGGRDPSESDLRVWAMRVWHHLSKRILDDHEHNARIVHLASSAMVGHPIVGEQPFMNQCDDVSNGLV